jgi:hypothetical protein
MRANIVLALLLAGLLALPGCKAGGVPNVPGNPGAGPAPLALPDVLTVEMNSLNNVIPALSNDIDLSGTGLTITAVSVTQTLPQAAGAVASTGGDNVLFTPPSNFTGIVTLQYIVEDGTGATSAAIIIVSVLPVALPPIALPDVATVMQNSSAADIDVLANDLDFAGGGLNVTGISVSASLPPAFHTVGISGNQVRFTPAAGFIGAVLVSYTATDVNGNSAEGQLTVVVSPLDLPVGPVALPDAAVVTQDSSATDIDVLANDVDVAGGGLAVTGVSVSASLPPAFHTVGISGNQGRFTPAAGFAGVVLVGYTATDVNGNSAEGLLSIVVSPLGLPVGPVALPDVAIVAQDSSATDINVLTNDVDVAGGGLAVTGVSVTGSLPPAFHTVIISSNRVRFTPAAGFAGAVVVSYTVTDVNGNTGVGLLNIVVSPSPLPLPPVALPDVAIVSSSGGATLIDVLVNDLDPAGGGLTLTDASILLAVPPGAGSVAIVGNQIQYTPAPLYIGAVEVTYTATDINGNTTVGQLVLTVVL